VENAAQAEAKRQRRIALAGCLTGSRDQQAILTVHNEQRARYCAGAPGAGTMLGWSPQVAAGAQQWAALCTRDPSDASRFAHSPQSRRNHSHSPRSCRR
jgi:hypothetical protein